MSTSIQDALRFIAKTLEAELAPLTTALYNNADITVSVGHDPIKGSVFEVWGPDHIEVYVPKTYMSFPVRFVVWDKTTRMNMTDEITSKSHNLFP